MIESILCWLQLRLYLLGLRRLAGFLERFMRPVPDRSEPKAPDASQAGPGWSLVELQSGRLQAIDFDPMFNRDPGVDMREVALPTTHLDIN